MPVTLRPPAILIFLTQFMSEPSSKEYIICKEVKYYAQKTIVPVLVDSWSHSNWVGSNEANQDQSFIDRFVSHYWNYAWYAQNVAHISKWHL